MNQPHRGDAGDPITSGPTETAAGLATADPHLHSAGPPARGLHWQADLFLLATAVMWGVNIPIVKDAITRLDPFLFNASRLVFSSLALALCAGIERHRASQKVPSLNSRQSRLPWQKILIFAAMTGFVYQIFFMLGITRTTAGNTALLLATMPVWTAILSFVFFGEKLPVVTWVGLAITLVGTIVVIVSGGKVSLQADFLWGNLWMLIASMIWAGATVYSRPLMKEISPLRLSFLSSVLTTPLHLAIAPWMMQFATRDYEPWQGVLFEWPILLAIIYSGAFSTGLAYATWNIGVRQVGGSHAAVFQNVVTLVAVTGGWFFLRESIFFAQIVGGICMICGLLIMRRGRR